MRIYKNKYELIYCCIFTVTRIKTGTLTEHNMLKTTNFSYFSLVFYIHCLYFKQFLLSKSAFVSQLFIFPN